MMTIWALRLWVRLFPFHTIEVYEHRERLFLDRSRKFLIFPIKVFT